MSAEQAGPGPSAPSAPESASVPESTKQVAPVAEPKRPIAPIPDKPKPTKSLPGVNLHTDADNDLRKMLAVDRNKDGKYEKEDVLTKAAKRELEMPPGDKQKQDEEPKTPELPAGEEKPSEKIKFAGKEYKNLAEIEQAHKSLQGMFRSHAEKIGKLSEERDYGYRAAAAWTDEAKRLQARVAELESSLQGGAGKVGQPQANAQPSSDLPSVDSVLEDIDTDAFERLAIDSGLPHAGKYLAAEILKVVSEKMLPALQAKWSQQIAPFESQSEGQRLMESMASVRNQVASLKTLDGKDAFPELNDPQIIHEVGKTWAESGLPPEHALTPQGLIQAVALYRLMKGLPSGQAEMPSNGASNPLNAPGPSASVSAEPGGAPPNRGKSTLSPEAQRLANAINAPTLVDPVLGFPRRNRR